MRLIIFGPPASGKGTQAALLAKTLNLQHISTGELLREEIASGSTLGSEIKAVMDRGDLVSPDIANQLTKKALEEHPDIIIDGYPRNMQQAEFLDSFITMDAIISLEVPDEVSIARITGRRVCPKGHDYHLTYKPPQQEGVCDEDGLPLSTRSDDTEVVIRHRLHIYHSETEPLLEHYKDKVVEIDGTPSIEDVNKAIIARLAPQQP